MEKKSLNNVAKNFNSKFKKSIEKRFDKFEMNFPYSAATFFTVDSDFQLSNPKKLVAKSNILLYLINLVQIKRYHAN